MEYIEGATLAEILSLVQFDPKEPKNGTIREANLTSMIEQIRKEKSSNQINHGDSEGEEVSRKDRAGW
ncbi:MAG: hypothetical protein HY360_18805 [Verrucomicrobia bacterium]|nr:hypothetical protein [Verrucomicrobiota bacterium]